MDFNNSSDNNIFGENTGAGTGEINSEQIPQAEQPVVNTVPVQPQASQPVVNTVPVQPQAEQPVVNTVPVQPQINPAVTSGVIYTETPTASAGATGEAMPVAEEKKRRAKKEKKEKKSGNIFLKLLTAALVGVVFGGCAFGAWSLADKYMPKQAEAIEEAIDEFDREAYKREIEKDILAKINKDQDASIVKSVTTESDVTMQVTDVSDVVDDVMPSVVSITNNYTTVINYWGRQISEESEASGSGIIIGENEKELLIATNNHVIEGANELHVQFIDGESVEAKVKGADSDNDIAVIAVAFDDMKASTKDAIEIALLGDSEDLRVGEPAIAIGNSLGYGQSVTTGVISALNRTLELEDGKISEGFIQTDAAINPGNSGGALLNVRGEVVGINSSKIGGASIEGMGYAIPISRALPIIDDLKTKKTKGSVNEDNRGYLGISGRAVSDEMVEVYEFPRGVFVYEVFENSGAEKAGLRKGDIIIKLEGSTIKSMEALQENLAYYEAGETVELTVSRLNDDGTYEEITLQVDLISIDEMPAE